ncbi:MAG: hypothetical protein WCA37_09500, partial [Terracidiphilus sp.]
NSPVTLLGLALSASSGFQLANNTCPASLAPGASCTTGVTFAPAQTGPQTGSLTVASTAMPVSAQASLSGTGFNFTATVNGPSSFTVASGQAASFTLNLAPQGGSTTTFSFQCGTLPAHTTCSFNPTTEAIAANANSNVTVNIATGQASTAALATQPRFWPAWPMACGFLLLPLALRKRRKWLLVVVALVFAGGLSSCSGAGGGTNSAPTNTLPGATPPGTYSVVVTSTANGLSRNVTLTLTVD